MCNFCKHKFIFYFTEANVSSQLRAEKTPTCIKQNQPTETEHRKLKNRLTIPLCGGGVNANFRINNMETL